jgi:hypothetical protein
VQEEQDQHERIFRVSLKDARSRDLIRIAGERHLAEQMREITARLGSAVVKIGAEEMRKPPDQSDDKGPE